MLPSCSFHRCDINWPPGPHAVHLAQRYERHIFEYHSTWPVVFRISGSRAMNHSPLQEVFYRSSSTSMDFVCFCGASFTGRTLMMIHRWSCLEPSSEQIDASPFTPEQEAQLEIDWGDHIHAPVPNSGEDTSYPPSDCSSDESA